MAFPEFFGLVEPGGEAGVAPGDGFFGGEEPVIGEGEILPAEGQKVIGEEGGIELAGFYGAPQRESLPGGFGLRLNAQIGFELRPVYILHDYIFGRPHKPEGAWDEGGAVGYFWEVRALAEGGGGVKVDSERWR